MALTREKYDAVVTLLCYNWSVMMISMHLNMPPWEVAAVIEAEERRRKPQLELFKPKREVA